MLVTLGARHHYRRVVSRATQAVATPLSADKNKNNKTSGRKGWCVSVRCQQVYYDPRRISSTFLSNHCISAFGAGSLIEGIMYPTSTIASVGFTAWLAILLGDGIVHRAALWFYLKIRAGALQFYLKNTSWFQQEAPHFTFGPSNKYNLLLITIRWITRHQTYPHGRINKGNASVKSFCKSEVYFVRYGQLFEPLD